MLCVALDIPLRDIKSYVDENGCLDEKSILIRGKKAMQERISGMQMKLETTQFSLDSIEKNQRYKDRKGVYRRRIEERFFIETPFCGDWRDFSREEKKSMELFHEAQGKNMVPVFPSGIIIHYEREPVQFSFYFQVLHPDKEDKRILHIPEGVYACLQTDMTFQVDMKQLLEENFPIQEKKMIIISNMLLNKLHFNNRRSEIQAAVSI